MLAALVLLLAFSFDPPTPGAAVADAIAHVFGPERLHPAMPDEKFEPAAATRPASSTSPAAPATQDAPLDFAGHSLRLPPDFRCVGTPRGDSVTLRSSWAELSLWVDLPDQAARFLERVGDVPRDRPNAAPLVDGLIS